MRMMEKTLRRWAVAGAVAAGLGFGAVQAMARPAPADEARRCSPSNCTLSCQRRGIPGGDCVNGACVCWST